MRDSKQRERSWVRALSHPLSGIREMSASTLQHIIKCLKRTYSRDIPFFSCSLKILKVGENLSGKHYSRGLHHDKNSFTAINRFQGLLVNLEEKCHNLIGIK